MVRSQEILRIRYGLFLFVIWGGLSSCSTHMTFYSGPCNREGIRFQSGIGRDFEVNKRVWTFLEVISKHRINLKNILEDRGISCDSIESILIVTEDDWPDAITRYIPLISSKTIKVSGRFLKRLKNTTVETEGKTDGKIEEDRKEDKEK